MPTTDCCCCREDDEDDDAERDAEARDDSSQAERFRFDRSFCADEVRALVLLPDGRVAAPHSLHSLASVYNPHVGQRKTLMTVLSS